jgi:hypothetical protein
MKLIFVLLILSLVTFGCGQKNGSYKTSTDEGKLYKPRTVRLYEKGNLIRNKYFKNDKLFHEIYLDRIDIPLEEFHYPMVHNIYTDTTGVRYKITANHWYDANGDTAHVYKVIGDSLIYGMFKIDGGLAINNLGKTVSTERIIRDIRRDYPIENVENGYIVIYNYLADMSNYLGIPKPYFSFLVKQYNKEGVLIPEKSGLFGSIYNNRIDFSVEKKSDRYVNEFIKELDEIK